MMRGRLSGSVGYGRAFAAVALVAALQSFGLAQTPARRQSQPQSGQTQSQSTQTQSQNARTESRGEADADLSITARVTAESLRFEKVPNPRVEFTGRPERRTVWESDRENLPQEVRPGVTYRDIGITLRITSVFADIDRIVAEALGEVPPSDDTPPQPARPQPPGTNTPPAQSTTPPSQTSANDAAATRQRRGVARRGRSN